MYLKKIDIFGFKSFANKTTIRFSEGVTAIVGPNGCGKTNVLDALRWVLGEQKPTLLRGGKMEEVIFNGTREMKPLGMSEVTLTIVNDKGLLPTEYNEIQIARRLFRSGESEYLINKVPCRLKDITDLFVDTGMGAHSYSVIQQDMIEAVISDKAEERRFLFEEAAGITKYKQRRKAALRKLEATEQDFLRLHDIHSEVKTRTNSLYRQHKKAERHQLVVNEIKAWELYLNSKRVQDLEQKRRVLQAEQDELSKKKIQSDTSLDGCSAKLEADNNELLDIERELNQINERINRSSDHAHSFEREISVLNEKKKNAQVLIERNNAEINNLSSRHEKLKTEIEQVKANEVLIRQELAEFQNKQANVEQIQSELDKQLTQARIQRENKNKSLLELEGKLSSGLTEESSLKKQEDEIQSLIQETISLLGEKEPNQLQILNRLTESRSEIDKMVSRRNEGNSLREQLTTTMETLSEKSEELTDAISNLQASLEAAEARKNLLEEMMLHYEGYESGVVVAMEERERWPEIAGTVAEKFVPVEGIETALESALGDMARFLICSTRKAAENIIGHLRDENKGRIGILVIQSEAIPAAVKRPEITMDGVVGWLDTFVSTDDSLRTLRDAVLARTIVIEPTLDPALILERLPHGFMAVSTDGTVYGQNQVSGGSDDHFPLFRRKEKVEEQINTISSLSSQIEQATNDKNVTVARLATARAEFSNLNKQQEELSEQITEAQSTLNEIDYEHRALTTELERLQREKRSLSKRHEEMRQKQYDLKLGSSKLANEKDTLLSLLSQDGSDLQQLEHDASNAVETVSKAQIATIESKSRLDQIQNNLNHLTELIGEINNNVDRNKEEIESATSEIQTSTTKVIELEAKLKEAYDNRDKENIELKQKREIQATIMERKTKQEKSVKEIRSTRDETGEEIHKLEIRLNTMDSEVRAICDRMSDEYEVNIRELSSDQPNNDFTDEQAPERLHELKEKLKKFGAVNLLALEEYREASEREKFLDEQLTDLETAKNDLNATISKINQTAKQLFNETLEKVQVHFSKLFVDLFTGGEASIKLVDPNDPLESDIDIIARPRGKKLLSITMMSGGERALTAIALLFSLYLVKPSPFCILDEIDAPLDDANCHRFLSIIHSFARQTQFIVITHNKITMEASDNLYGVTMEQPGISKLVSVKFDKSTEADEPVKLDRSFEEELPPEPNTEIETQLPETIQERLSSSIELKNSDQ